MKIVILSKLLRCFLLHQPQKSPALFKPEVKNKLSQRFFLILPDARRSLTNHNPLMGPYFPSPSNHKDFPSWVFKWTKNVTHEKSNNKTIKMETKRGHHHTSTCYFWPVSVSLLGNFFVTPFLKTKEIFTEEIIVLLFQQKSHARLASHFMLLFWRLENSIWSTTYFLRFCNFLNEKSWKSIISVLWALEMSEIFEGFLYV